MKDMGTDGPAQPKADQLTISHAYSHGENAVLVWWQAVRRTWRACRRIGGVVEMGRWQRLCRGVVVGVGLWITLPMLVSLFGRAPASNTLV